MPASPPSRTVAVSVVIPIFNAKGRLDQLLSCLERLDPAPTEVILVDDGSSDDTLALCERAKQRLLWLQVYTQRNSGPASARNLGIQRATMPYVAFTDDDCLPSPGWLEQPFATLEAYPEVVAVFGKIEAGGHKSYLTHWVENGGEGHQTANAVYRAKVLRDLGGFDVRFRQPYLEDTDLYLRAARAGQTRYAPQAQVLHPVRESTLKSRVKRMKLYRNDFLLHAKHPELYRLRHGGRAPLGYLWYFVLLKHTLAVVYRYLYLIRESPSEFGALLLSLAMERCYLALLLVAWTFVPPFGTNAKQEGQSSLSF